MGQSSSTQSPNPGTSQWRWAAQSPACSSPRVSWGPCWTGLFRCIERLPRGRHDGKQVKYEYVLALNGDEQVHQHCCVWISLRRCHRNRWDMFPHQTSWPRSSPPHWRHPRSKQTPSHRQEIHKHVMWHSLQSNALHSFESLRLWNAYGMRQFPYQEIHWKMAK